MSYQDEGALLLRRFVEDHSQEAFSELVEKKIDIVYSMALRQLGGDEQLAKDVAQTVFIDLIHNAPAIAGGPSVNGWLFVSTRFAARKAWRKQMRWRIRQQEGHHMMELIRNQEPDQVWSEIRPVLDDAMSELGPAEREVILARFFDERSLGDIAKQYGVNENAARMRVERALEKLRLRLNRRGIQSATSVLAGALTTGALGAAPAGFAGTVAGGALAGAALKGAGGALAWETFRFITMRKLTIAATLSALALATGTVLVIHYLPTIRRSMAGPNVAESIEWSSMREQIRRLKEANARLVTQSSSGFGKTQESGLERLRLLVEMSKQGIVHDPVLMTNWQGMLDKKFADLFQLSPAETHTLQRALDTARARLQDLSQANAKVVEQSSGKVVVRVDPFPQAGGAIYDELYASITSVLGPDRTVAFSSLSADGLEDAFAAFGAAERTVTITNDPTSANVPSLVEDQWKRADDSGTTIGTATYSLVDVANVDRLGLGSIVPAEFQQVPANAPSDAQGYDTVSHMVLPSEPTKRPGP